MKKNKKYLIEFIVIILITLCIIPKISFAFGVGDFGNNDVTPGELKTGASRVLGVIATIGSVVSVLVLVVLGIKYMLGSVEEKAEYKKSMLPYVIGAVLVFAASTITSVIYNVAINIK